MGRPKKYANTREVLLTAAENLFRQFGSMKVTMEDIALAADLGKASIYKEFPSKEELLLAVVERFLTNNSAELAAIAEDANTPEVSALHLLQQALLKRILTIYDYATQNVQSEELLVAAPRSQAKVDAQLQTLSKRFAEEDIQLIESLLRKAADKSEIAPQENYAFVARLIHSSLISFFPPVVVQRPTSRSQIAAEASQMLRLVLAGLQTLSQTNPPEGPPDTLGTITP
jgi:AcrR family transcriptional regulator